MEPPKLISVSVDVTKLDKSRFFPGKNGAKYANLVLVHTPDGKFGDYMVKIDSTKEEREQRVQMPIVGNGKIIGTGGGQRQQQRPVSRPPARPQDPDLDPDDDSGVPF